MTGEENATEATFDIDVVDTLLPCRRYAISYRVAEAGKLSLASEFVLRLVHSVDGMPEREAGEFFGFSGDEIAYAVDDLVTLGYVERRGEALWLTASGQAAFSSGTDEPELYEVEQRTDRHAFDLASFSPARFESLSAFEMLLPELPVPSNQAASGSRSVPAAFRRHFDDLVRRATSLPLRRALLSVDSVTPLERFLTVVPVRVKGKISAPASIEPDVSASWTGYELDDRAEVVQSVSTFLRSARVRASDLDNAAFAALAKVAGEATHDYSRRERFRKDAFLRDALRRAGELRSDRPTTFIVGSLLTDANQLRLRRAFSYVSSDADDGGVVPIFWHIPMVPMWGASRRLPQVVESLQHAPSDEGIGMTLWPVAAVGDVVPRHVDRAFDTSILSRAKRMSVASVEIFLLPKRLAAVLVHAGIEAPESYAIPLGILTFDQVLVQRASELLRSMIEPMHILKHQGDYGVLQELIEGTL